MVQISTIIPICIYRLYTRISRICCKRSNHYVMKSNGLPLQTWYVLWRKICNVWQIHVGIFLFKNFIFEILSRMYFLIWENKIILRTCISFSWNNFTGEKLASPHPPIHHHFTTDYFIFSWGTYVIEFYLFSDTYPYNNMENVVLFQNIFFIK